VDANPAFSFTMLTVNANEHPLMRRFHKLGDEKRSVVIVPPDAYDDWLSCRNTDEARSFLNVILADRMYAQPYPLPPRKQPRDAYQAPGASLFE
jgi:putative SOS response-associated peptidase YedK